MRIALCLSGQPRTWRWTHESLTAFFAGHDTDVFFHTWREGDPGEVDAVIAAYRPRAHLIQERPLFVAEKRLMAERFPTRPPLTIFDMFHSAAESLNLAAAGDYDLVVRTRFDALFDGTWSGETPGEAELIVPDFYPDANGCTDQFALGRPAEMQAYGAVGAWLARAIGEITGGDWLRPEPVMRHYLEQVCGLKVALRPIAMRLLREEQAGQPFAALADDPLFHAAKHEDWERFARDQFPEVADRVDFDHAARTALELDRALSAWLADRPRKDAFQLLQAPWSRRIEAVDAFIAEQAGGLETVDEGAYRGVRLICAMLLQRMDRREPMNLESFVVHALSANILDMRRAADWATVPGRLDDLGRALKGLGPLARALTFANPLDQTGIGAWRTA